MYAKVCSVCSVCFTLECECYSVLCVVVCAVFALSGFMSFG